MCGARRARCRREQEAADALRRADAPGQIGPDHPVGSTRELGSHRQGAHVVAGTEAVLRPPDVVEAIPAGPRIVGRQVAPGPLIQGGQRAKVTRLPSPSARAEIRIGDPTGERPLWNCCRFLAGERKDPPLHENGRFSEKKTGKRW